MLMSQTSLPEELWSDNSFRKQNSLCMSQTVSTSASPSEIIHSKMHFCFALRSVNLTFLKDHVRMLWLDCLALSFATFIVRCSQHCFD